MSLHSLSKRPRGLKNVSDARMFPPHVSGDRMERPMSRKQSGNEDCGDWEARVRESSLEGLLWDAASDGARKPLYDLNTVVDAEALAATATTNATERTIAVTFMSREYARVGLNWVEAMRRLGWSHYLVIAGDLQTRRALDALSVPCVEARVADGATDASYVSAVGFTRKGLAMTALKFPIVRALLRLGLSVIMSDADAVWLKNPMTPIASWDVDVAFQRVVYFPKAIASLWGFAACSGFVFFRSTPGTIALLEACVNEHRGVQDDQVALNLALLGAGTRWPQSVPRSDTERCRNEADLISEFRRAARRAIRGRATKYGLDVMALPHHQFWRHDWLEADRCEMVICHPNTPKDDSEKMKRFKELGLRYD